MAESLMLGECHDGLPRARPAGGRRGGLFALPATLTSLFALTAVLSLVATQTNLVPVSALIVPTMMAWAVCAGRIPRNQPTWWWLLALLTLWQMGSTMLYDPRSLVTYRFYRYDFHNAISWVWLLAVPFARPHALSPHRLMAIVLWTGLPILGALLALYIVVGRHQTFGGLFYARNAFGGYLAVIGCLCLANMGRGDGRRAFPWRIDRWSVYFLVVSLSLLLTLSRGSMLGLIAAGGLFAWSTWIRRIRTTARHLALVLAVAALGSWGAGAIAYRQFGSPEQQAIVAGETKLNNLYIRATYLWPKAFAQWARSPLVGNGFGTFNDEVRREDLLDGVLARAVPGSGTVNHHDGHAHNTYLHLLAEQGILGLALFLAVLVALHAEVRRRYGGGSTVAAFSYYGLVCLAVMSLTENRLTTPSNALPFTVLLGLLLLVRRGETGRRAEPEPVNVRNRSLGS